MPYFRKKAVKQRQK